MKAVLIESPKLIKTIRQYDSHFMRIFEIKILLSLNCLNA